MTAVAPGRLPRVAALVDLGPNELKRLWCRTFATQPPKRMRRDLLVRVLAFETQLRAAGGWPRGLERQLDRMVEHLQLGESAASRVRTRRPAGLRPGSRLLRTYRGVTHEVVVLDPGFVWQGRKFASLSEVARAITGSTWSGPVFFGLKKPERARRKAGAAALLQAA